MPVDLVAELAPASQCGGMNHSYGDVARPQAIFDAHPTTSSCIQGASSAAKATLRVGYHAVITGSLNYVPRLVMDVVEKDPNQDLQSSLTVIWRVERTAPPSLS